MHSEFWEAAKKALNIHIDDIPEDGLALSPDVLAPFTAQAFVALGEPQPTDSVQVSLRLNRLESTVSVHGSVSGALSLACARCLEPVSVPVDDRFHFYLRTAPVAEVAGEEVALTGDQLDFSFMQDSQVDVPALVQEQLSLEMPEKVLCRADCKGICQGCGAELNHEPCRCTAGKVDSRFAVLKQFKVKSSG